MLHDPCLSPEPRPENGYLRRPLWQALLQHNRSQPRRYSRCTVFEICSPVIIVVAASTREPIRHWASPNAAIDGVVFQSCECRCGSKEPPPEVPPCPRGDEPVRYCIAERQRGCPLCPRGSTRRRFSSLQVKHPVVFMGSCPLVP